MYYFQIVKSKIRQKLAIFSTFLFDETEMMITFAVLFIQSKLMRKESLNHWISNIKS